ncbi:hypothetical protein LTR62_002593 [Meristemomyces frigidus]|uniref:Protein SYS1 n=1 Tax=Meristemomyces frigidus TaxID=1508187 RepID=A0AAN7TKL3_9PEZI|nr:hypothetical protein LTR62_002593 [Meristemomyces frigidus]
MPRRRPPRPGALADLAPLRILKQIALLQLSYYGVAGILITFITFVAGQQPTVNRLFDWHELRSDVTTGWTLGLCWMLDSLVTVIPILLLIARSKLVPDFALTIHLVNLITTIAYTRSIPTALYWWIVQICSAALMTSVGIWACQWRELRTPLPFGGKSSKAKQGAANGHASGSGGAVEEENGGFEMGSTSGGRGRDGGGAYEMVEMGQENG